MGRKVIPLIIGIAAAAAVYIMPAPAGLEHEGQRAIAVFIFAATLWMTRAIPLAATGLLAAALLGVCRVVPPWWAFSRFGNSFVFFLIGVFILTAAMIRTGLSKRLTLVLIGRFSRSPRRLLFGVLFTSAFIAFWMPEHAAASMMFPIVSGIVKNLGLKPGRSNYAKAVFMAMAWGAIIGGTGTLLGGVRAPIAVGLLTGIFNMDVGFSKWMLAALPVVVMLTPAAYLMLVKTFRVDVADVSQAREYMLREIGRMGPMSAAEKKMAVLMSAAVVAWLFLGNWIDPTVVSVMAAASIFVLRIADWPEVEEYVNWGAVLMVGGAIAVGEALIETGAAGWIAKSCMFASDWPVLIVIPILAVVSMAVSEIAGGAVAVAALVPLGLELAIVVGMNPLTAALALTLPAGLAFCSPAGSPPNAVAFSSGYYGIRDVVRRGLWLNAAVIAALLTAVCCFWTLMGLF